MHKVCIPHKIPRAWEQQGWNKRKKQTQDKIPMIWACNSKCVSVTCTACVHRLWCLSSLCLRHVMTLPCLSRDKPALPSWPAPLLPPPPPPPPPTTLPSSSSPPLTVFPTLLVDTDDVTDTGLGLARGVDFGVEFEEDPSDGPRESSSSVGGSNIAESAVWWGRLGRVDRRFIDRFMSRNLGADHIL